MKVLNLRCSHEHRFEGWFASVADFESQDARGLVACPMCDDKAITRLPSAPRLSVSKLHRVERDEAVEAAAVSTQTRMQAQWLHAVRQVLNNTEDVGTRFPEEARRIHYGEAQGRGIRGQASREDAQALRDEGIEVMTVALPEPLKGPLQ
jgi:hypothetical protein